MKNNKKGLWGIIVAVGLFLLSKLKWVFAIFKLAKFSTVFSMFLSLGAYAVLYGWKFGVALIYLLFVHVSTLTPWTGQALLLSPGPGLHGSQSLFVEWIE